MLVGQKLRFVSLWNSASFHAFVIIGTDALPGCAPFHGFANWVRFDLVNVPWTDSFFGIFVTSWRFGWDHRLASGLDFFGFCWVLLYRRFGRCVFLWSLDSFRQLTGLYGQLRIRLDRIAFKKLINFERSLLSRRLGLFLKVIISIPIILKVIILTIFVILFLFSGLSLCRYRLDRLGLCFCHSFRRLSRKHFLTVFRFFFVINRLLQRFFKILLIEFIVVIVLFCWLFVIGLAGLCHDW